MLKLKTVLLINIALFSLIGLLHLLRIILQWKVSFGEKAVPYWPNLIGILIAIAMVYINAKHVKTIVVK